MRRRLLALVGTLGSAAVVVAGTVDAPTFSKDVAPILYEKCATCHRPGEVAPMPLLSYEDARPWAKAIKAKVMAREMPPWGANPANTLPMRNDRSLSQQQIDTIAAWVDGGAPRGSDADLPPRPSFVEGWTFGREPDYVIEMPTAFEVPAQGELSVQNFYTRVPFDEDVFAEVVELRPGNRELVHHAGIYFADLPAGATLDEHGRLIRPDNRDNREATNAAAARGDAGLPGS